jgi:hypothetical protein
MYVIVYPMAGVFASIAKAICSFSIPFIILLLTQGLNAYIYIDAVS